MENSSVFARRDQKKAIERAQEGGEDRFYIAVVLFGLGEKSKNHRRKALVYTSRPFVRFYFYANI